MELLTTSPNLVKALAVNFLSGSAVLDSILVFTQKKKIISTMSRKGDGGGNGGAVEAVTESF